MLGCTFCRRGVFEKRRSGSTMSSPVVGWSPRKLDIRGSGADPGFQIREGAHLKKLRRAEGGAKKFGVFRVKNHDFTPKNLIFSNIREDVRRLRPPLDPPLGMILVIKKNVLIGNTWKAPVCIRTRRTCRMYSSTGGININNTFASIISLNTFYRLRTYPLYSWTIVYTRAKIYFNLIKTWNVRSKHDLKVAKLSNMHVSNTQLL